MNIKILNDKAKMPTRGSEKAAGYDMYAAIDEPISIPPHKSVMVPTGIAMEVPDGYFVGLFPRSGISFKRGLRLSNCVGVIDSDYRGEVLAPIHNDFDYEESIEPGERVCQFIILPYIVEDLNEVDGLSDTARGEGGFGSTGEK